MTESDGLFSLFLLILITYNLEVKIKELGSRRTSGFVGCERKNIPAVKEVSL